RAGGEDLGEVGPFNAADAEDGNSPADFVLDSGDVIQTDAGAALFGRGGEERTEADVVEAFFQGGAGLAGRMGRAAEEERGTRNRERGMNEGASFGKGAVVLTD